MSLTIAAGEVVAVTGASGSGKSTLLHCLAGITVPEAGEVHYDGTRLDSMSERERSVLRRGPFGIVFQFGQLVPELTAEENVALPLLLARHKRDASMTAARAWLDRFDVADLAGARPAQLSGGQSQRIAVARALVTEPRVVFADEPTGALDSLAAEQVLGQLLRVVRESGTTVVLVTHDARVAAYADREVTVHDGTTTTSQVPA
jgi:putative ABC transport system ATP-binding protein